MDKIQRDKFRRNRDLRERLATTGDRELTNTLSTPTDSSKLFWGVVNGKGQNQLGRIIEKIRQDILEESELDKWIYTTLNLMEQRNAIPTITI